ncbi:hypothetical protein JCM3765_007225 [Sporobolomyces pararoseus]
MIPSRTQSSTPAPRKESIPHKLARLRSEQSSSRTRFNSSNPSSSSSTPVAAWLRPVDTSQGRRTATARGRRGTAGPPPPPSWRQESQLSNLIVSPPVGPRLRQRQLLKRKNIVEPLVPSERGGGSTRANTGAVASLFNLAGQTLARDLGQGQSQSILLEHVAYLPTHLKIRLLNEVMADYESFWNLTNAGAKELLRTDVDEIDDRGWEDSFEDSDKDEWDQEEADAVQGTTSMIEPLDFRDEFTSPLSTSLTILNLSFSSITLKTLRSVFLRPSSTTPPTSAPPKLLSTFPHLHTLLLCSTKNIPFLHDQFFNLLTLLLSLRNLSLPGNSLLLPPNRQSAEDETACCSTKLFLPRLAAATPLLNQVDLSYISLSSVDGSDEVEKFDVRNEVCKRIDWEIRWLDLKVIGLRTIGGVELDGEDQKVESERIRKEIRGIVAEKRKRGKWLDVVL